MLPPICKQVLIYSQLAISYNNDFGIECLSHVGSQLENKIRKSECMDVSPTSNDFCVCVAIVLWRNYLPSILVAPVGIILLFGPKNDCSW